VFHAVKLLNFFPTKGGVSDTLSPKTILSGETLDYKKHLRLVLSGAPGRYTAQQSTAKNERSKISLGPSGNLQGGFKEE
jgi:hypothetical protein